MSQTFGWNFSAWLSKRHSSCRDDYFELFFSNRIFVHWFPDLEFEKFRRCRKNLTGFVKASFSPPEENFKSFVGKKVVMFTGSRNWAIFSDFCRKFFHRKSKLLYSSCPDVNLIQNFFYLENCFIYLSFPASEQTFPDFWPTFYRRVVKIAFH